jgi:sterol 24-C-methyltransferase
MDGDLSRVRGLLRLEKDSRSDWGEQIQEYTNLYDESLGDKSKERKNNYTAVVNKYYDLATDFYEFGWGHSFHFAARHKWESLEASIARHEMWLAHRMGIHKGMKVIDLGCGVGGPLRTIARFAGASIVGLNNNEYQISRARKLTQDAHLDHLGSFVKGDFMHIPFPDGSFDAAYQIEASCHAPDREGVYREIFRILKPGSYFGGFEWVMTDQYDPNDKSHVSYKKGIERGNGLPDLETIRNVLDAMERAGFEITEQFDLAPTSDIPWYYPLTGRLTPQGLLHTWLGRYISLQGLRLLEWMRIAPSGSSGTLDMLQRGSDALVAAGKLQIFTPMFWVLARKPL